MRCRAEIEDGRGCHQARGNEGLLWGDAQRSCDDPPFVDLVDADELDSLGKVVRLRGQLKNTSSESLKTEFANFGLQFC